MRILPIYNIKFNLSRAKRSSYYQNIAQIPKTSDCVNFTSLRKDVYSVDSEGNYKRYLNMTQAAESTGISLQDISHIINGKQKSSKGYTFARGEDVDEISWNRFGCKVKPDKEKIESLRQIASEKVIYAINNNGECKRYKNQREASEELGISQGIISLILKMERKSAGNYTFVSAKKLESVDADGNVVLNKKKAEDYRQLANIKSIYVIDKNGNYTKCDSQKTASDLTGATASRISAVLAGRAHFVNEYGFVWANDVEKIDDDGNIVVDKKIIKKNTPKPKKY